MIVAKTSQESRDVGAGRSIIAVKTNTYPEFVSRLWKGCNGINLPLGGQLVPQGMVLGLPIVLRCWQFSH